MEEEVVAVRGPVIESRARLLGRAPGAARPNPGMKLNMCGEEQGAVVVGVVAHEPVRDGSLRRDGLERRVGVDHPGGRIETGIRDSPHPDLAVVVRDVLDEPVDGVVRVAAFVDVVRPFLCGMWGRTSTNLPSDIQRPRTSW